MMFDTYDKLHIEDRLAYLRRPDIAMISEVCTKGTIRATPEDGCPQ